MGKEIEKEAEEWAEGRFDYRDYKDARFKLDHPIEGYVRGYLAARLKYEVKIAEAYLAGLEGAKRTAQPRWISVKERLPEPNQLVVILYRDQKPFNNRNPPTYFGRHTGKYWYEALDHSDVAWNTKLQPITHWMEIPAAPEGEK